MDDYAREVERLTQMYEEVATDEENFSDSDDSVADPQYEEVSDHQSESGQELEEDELYEELLVQSSASERDHLQFEAKDGTKSDARSTNIPELRALFGLLYLAGVYHGGRTSVYEFWYNDGTEHYDEIRDKYRKSFLQEGQQSPACLVLLRI
ncbi:hypothetical protein NQ314_017368 [Rhamnusium bicolor]|uniref:PiggyBac transposable element-derived protein domain-containing protein n=1 Tax=Rhamnusium bicolor TaxID=1586634 RepID=A0AAV8WTF5_9CUCU|nr:hypothetical protein NQ314_017368 [Rhamnusium bicolor]